MRVFENRVLRRIFGTKRYEVTGEWRKLHNAKRNGLYPSPNDQIENEMGGACSTCGGAERRGAYGVGTET